jgi:hypothetical protein
MNYEIWPADGTSPDDGTGRSASSGANGFGPGGYPGDYTVGQFRQGDDLSQWALRRYLLVRAVGTSVVRTVQWIGIGILVIAVLVWFAGVHWLAILAGLFAVLVLGFRAVLSAVQNHLSGASRLGPVATDVERLVGRTRREMRAELRRVGFPGGPLVPAVVGYRVARRRTRGEAVRRLTTFDLTQVVPVGTLDELHLLLQRTKHGLG